jgi:opacity protein-like surface antigen
MIKLAIASVLFLFVLPAAASAQDIYPQTEFFGALSDDGHTGWLGSLAYMPSDHFGLEGDISGHYGGGVHRYHFDFGPRVKVATSDARFAAMAHLLLGASHESFAGAGSTSFSWILGGGGDYNFNDTWGARVQIDLVRTHFAGGAQNHGRYSIGFIYRFGQ